MEIYEDNDFYDQKYLIDNTQTDSRRLIIYDFPATLNENGIYNILEHIECTPSSIVLMNKNELTKGDQIDYVVSSKTNSVAIVEFASKSLVDKAFYVITSQYKKYFDAQYAYRAWICSQHANKTHMII